MNTVLNKCLVPQPKSKVKAGNGLDVGKYRFFTSSPVQSKYLDEYQYDSEALIFGTGGNASVHYCNEPFSTSTDCLVMYGKDGVNLKMIYYYLLGNIHLLQNGFKGAGLKHISKSYILEIPINLPLYEEQTKIIKIFDMIFKIENQLNSKLVCLDKIVKSRFVEMFGDPITNSNDLPTLPMTDLCVIIDGDRGKNYPKANEFFDNGFCLFLNAKNVTALGFNFENCSFITKEKDEVLRKGKLTRGDIVLTTRGTLGNLAFYTDDIPYENIRINSGMVILRMKHSLANEVFFIEQFKLQLSNIKEKIASGSAQPQLPISTMNKISILIPSLDEQNQFATFVEQVDKSKLAVKQALDKAEILKNSLMQEYFG
jgi:type I restriction enzyme S subunit